MLKTLQKNWKNVKVMTLPVDIQNRVIGLCYF